MGTDPQLIEILENEGFRNIAYAIRHSTVIPQYLKQKGDALYDVRYGLGMELKRKAAYPKEFLTALGVSFKSTTRKTYKRLKVKRNRSAAETSARMTLTI